MSNLRANKIGGSLTGTGINIDNKGKKSISLNPGIRVGDVSLNYNVGASLKGNRSNAKTSTSSGFSGAYDFARGGFKGKMSGMFGKKKSNGKTIKTASSRLSLGYGKSSSKGSSSCGPAGCEYTRGTPGFNIKAFGERNFKTKQTKVGISGRYGALSGEASYNINTKKPEAKIGVSIPLGKLNFGRNRF